MRRRHIEVFGRVQGVGFRWFASRWASQLNLTGWVCNREEGRVEMEVQGEETGVQAFLEAVSQGPPFARVEQVESRLCPLEEEERTFHVRDGWT